MKSIIYIRLIILATAMLLVFTQCKKDDANQRTPEIDLTDANIRVVKVEVMQNTYFPPFISEEKYYITYYYDASGVTGKATILGWIQDEEILKVSQLSETEIFVSHSWLRVFSESTLERTYLLYYGGLGMEGNLVRNPKSSLYRIQSERVETVIDTFDATIAPLVGYTFGSQFRRLDLKYEGSSFLSAKALYSYKDYGHLTSGEGVSISNVQWSGNVVQSYKVKNILNKNFPESIIQTNPPFEIDSFAASELIIHGPVMGNSFTVGIQYKEAPGVPKMLLKMINQALGDLLPTSISDYLVTYMAYFDDDSFYWRNNSENIRKPTAYFNNDWILTFANPHLTVLPDQDKIISSKTMQGQFLSNIVNHQPLYKILNSTTTFPYTHDPVAKTLEIAGLKIWYEVVE